MANILLNGNVFTGSGAAVVGATVELLARNTLTPVLATYAGGTSAAGLWNFSHTPPADRRIDVRISNGTSISFLKYDDQIQVSSVETANLRVINPAFSFVYDIVPAAITADRQLNLPLIPGTDTVAVLALAQTFLTGVKTFNSSIMAIRNPADTFSYTVVAAAITAARSLTLPLLTGNATVAVLEDVVSGGQSFAGAISLTGATGNTLVVDTTVLVVDATNNRVGIGLTAPLADLHIVNAGGGPSLRLQGANGNPVIESFSAAGTRQGYIVWYFNSDITIVNEGSSTAGILLQAGSTGTVKLRVGATVRVTVTNDGNVGIGTPDQFGSGAGVIGLLNATTNPTTNPTGGGVMYATGGAGTWRGSGGTLTTFGAAGPHCNQCGYDFWRVASRNAIWGSSLMECGWCGKVYRSGPASVLHLLTAEQRADLL